MTVNSTVFLVDDDEAVRDALSWLIESIELNVETFESASQFLGALDLTRPGCLVLDVRMPGMSGLELQEELHAAKSGWPVILITGHGDVPMCSRAFETGAFAFLEKPVNQQRLLDYVQRAIDQDRKDRLPSQPCSDLAPRLELLTPREIEVMEMLISGKSMKQIASELSISIPTCSKHRTRVLDNLRVENDVELVRLLLSGGRSTV